MHKVEGKEMNGYFKILVRNFLSVLYMDYISGTFLSILYMDYIVESSSIYSPDKHFIFLFFFFSEDLPNYMCTIFPSIRKLRVEENLYFF